MVRIALEQAQKHAAIVSLVVAGIAAATVWAGYWVWNQDRPELGVQRQLTDVIVRWQCPGDHVFEAAGSYDPRPCPTCQQPARVLVSYRCPKDGSADGQLMFDSGTHRLAAVKFGGGDWRNVTSIVPCPRCGGELRPQERSPFAQKPGRPREDAGSPAAAVAQTPTQTSPPKDP